MRKGLFPLSVPVLEGRSIVAWVEDEIDAYVESRRRARDHKLKEEAAKAKAAPDDPRKTALAAGCKETAEIG
jgi:hypothetical protein